MAAVIVLISVKCMDFQAVTWPHSLVSRAFIQLKQLQDRRVVMSSRVNVCSAGLPCNLKPGVFCRVHVSGKGSSMEVRERQMELHQNNFTHHSILVSAVLPKIADSSS